MKDYIHQEIGKQYIVGIEFSGNPKVSHFTEYKALFKQARNEGYKISVHAAEKEDQHDQLDEILAFRPDRLGHTTHAKPDQLREIAKLKIPVQICPTSNLYNIESNEYGALRHFKILNEEGATVLICTDDTGLFRVNHTDEVTAIAQGFNLSGEQLAEMQLKGVDAIFDQNEDLKERMRVRVKKFLEELKNETV